MSEEPSIPEPIPEIPRGALWRALAIPPAATSIGNMFIGLFAKNGNEGVLTFSLLPLVVFGLIIGFSIQFNRTVGQRYRGRSLVFLTSAYLLGQIIVCLTLWIGTCVLFFKY